MLAPRVERDRSEGARLLHHTGGRDGCWAKVPGSCGRVTCGVGKAGGEGTELPFSKDGGPLR